MSYSDRNFIYAAAVTIPASKTAAAVTISSAELYPFEGTGWGGANVTVYVADASLIGDSIAIKTYVSFDEGTTWTHTNTNTTLASGDSTSSTTNIWIPMAPRLRVDAVFSAAATLTVLHGIDISVEFKEIDADKKRTIFIGDSVIEMGDTITTGTSWTKTGTSLEVNSPSEIDIYVTAADASKVGDTIACYLESSIDGTAWWAQSTLGTVDLVNGDSIPISLYEEETALLSKYARIKVMGDTVGSISTGHGIQFVVIAKE